MSQQKRKKGKKQKESKTKGDILLSDGDEQIYGLVTKVLGGKTYTIAGYNGKTYRGLKRKLRGIIQTNTTVLCSLREYDIKNVDIIHLYDDADVKVLKKDGHLGIYSQNTEEKSIVFENVDPDLL